MAGTVVWGDSAGMKLDANLDGGYFRLPSPPAVKNEYFVSPSDIDGIVGELTNAEQYVGRIICRSGTASGYGCGYVRAADVYVNLPPAFNHMWKVELASYVGDSGSGMVGHNHDGSAFAAGVLSGGTIEGICPLCTKFTWYSSIADADAYLGLHACTGPNC